MNLVNTRGQWLLEWKAYPRALVAALLQAHRLPDGYEAPGLQKSEAYSLRVRLQKMQAGLRLQASQLPPELADAARQVRWVVVAVSPTSYTLRGHAAESLTPTVSAEAQAATLPPTLVGDAILARLLDTDTPTPPAGSHL